jgi:hypothetical protein
MAPSSKPVVPRSKGGFAARMTAKVGPLPVWGWAVAIIGLYLLYTRLHPAPAATTTTDTTATPDTSGDSGSQLPVSGAGSAADNFSGALLDQLGANTSAIDALTSQILSQPVPGMDANGAPTPGAPTDTSGNGSGSTPPPAAPPPTPHPVATGGNVAHMTQTAAGQLQWGGLTFTTKAAFDSWAKAHGSSTASELKNHPQARQIYGTLK